jgi:sugar lactone lactonase YvrE
MKKLLLPKAILATVLATFCFHGANAQGIITTIAGNGTAGTSGDGGQATSAMIASPVGVSINGAGDIYLAYSNVCRKITGSTGVISTVSTGGLLVSAAHIWTASNGNTYITDHYADQVVKINGTTGAASRHCGNGHQGHSGDGGQATNGTLMIPGATCSDKYGNTYIADRGSHEIRKVNGATGILSTICGNGGSGFSGDGGAATAAMVNSPNGICSDTNGNIYFADCGNHRIRKINATTGVVTTFCGTGTAGFSGDGGLAVVAKLSSPTGLFADKNGNIYIADQGNNRVRKITPGHIITTIAGGSAAGFTGDGGPSSAALLSSPNAVWVDNVGNVFIADVNNNRIRKITNHSSSKPLANYADENIVVFPNPSTGTITLQADASLVGNAFEVYNMLGAKVYASTVTDVQTVINLDQPSGNYFLILQTENGNISRQIAITK